MKLKEYAKEYAKELEKEKYTLQNYILSKLKDFEDLTGLSVEGVVITKLYGAANNKSNVVQVEIKALI